MVSNRGGVLIAPRGLGIDHNIWLYAFGINQADLKQLHVEALKVYIFPVLAAGGSATILGMASSTGSDHHNSVLSLRRANAVSSRLKVFSSSFAGQIRTVKGLGESLARLTQMDDGVESEMFRAVSVSVWSKSAPPPPPPPPPLKTSPLRYRCKTGARDPDMVDRINNQDRWLVPGASGDVNALHRFIKGFELAIGMNPSAGERRLWEFYRTSFFQDWFLGGHCSVIDKYPMEQISRWTSTYLTHKGRKDQAIYRKLIEKALLGLGSM